MCGRFTLTNPDPAALAEQFALPTVPQVTLTPRYNIAPTQPIAAVFNDAQGQNQLALMFWGLIPSWSKDASGASKLINARAETVAEKPSFRVALSKRRCLVIADGFYEWQTVEGAAKQPMRITVGDNGLFGFAGLYEYWTDKDSGEVIQSCTIITTTPNRVMEPIHNRMPVIIPPTSYAAWLDYKTTDSAQVLPMLAPYPPDQMRAYPVSRAVNNPRSDSPGMIQPS